MVLNYIWLAFFLTAFAVASVRLIFFGDTICFSRYHQFNLCFFKDSL